MYPKFRGFPSLFLPSPIHSLSVQFSAPRYNSKKRSNNCASFAPTLPPVWQVNARKSEHAAWRLHTVAALTVAQQCGAWAICQFYGHSGT